MGTGQQGQQGQYGQSSQGQPQGQSSQEPYGGQQSGVIGGIPNPGYPQAAPAPHGPDVSPVIPPNKPSLQSHWSSPGPEQHAQSGIPHQQYQNLPSPPLPQSPQPQQQQQWQPMSPLSPQGHQSIPPASVSPPPPQQTYGQPQAPPNHVVQKPQPTQSPTPVSHHSVPPPGPTEFIAELPADMGNLSIAETKPYGAEHQTQGAQYQAYNPAGAPAGSPSNRFSVPRRSVSTSGAPLADPWRFVDPMTEVPTREFYIIADLLFDALDRKCEPYNTGLLEGPKILKSWFEMPEDSRRK